MIACLLMPYLIVGEVLILLALYNHTEMFKQHQMGVVVVAICLFVLVWPLQIVAFVKSLVRKRER
jgi:hypothetical protein